MEEIKCGGKVIKLMERSINGGISKIKKEKKEKRKKNKKEKKKKKKTTKKSLVPYEDITNLTSLENYYSWLKVEEKLYSWRREDTQNIFLFILYFIIPQSTIHGYFISPSQNLSIH